MRASYQKKLDAWKNRRKRILELNNAGKSYWEIAKDYNITPSAVSQLVKKARLDFGEPEREGS